MIRNRPPVLGRADLIARGLLVPAGDPSAPIWHHEPVTLRIDAAGRLEAAREIAMPRRET